MPDLSPKSVHEFWNQYHDKMIYRVVSFMEGVETWIHDGDPKLEEVIQEFGKELDNISTVDMRSFGHENQIINLCNTLSSGRALRLLHVIDSAHPGSASKILIYAEENSQSPDDPPGLFLRRNIVFERLRLIARAFSAERLTMILKALEGEEHE